MLTALDDVGQAGLRERWDALHGEARYCPRYPDEAVVRWALTSFPGLRRGSTRALDLGCGAGRHAVFLAREGFETFAVDLSRAGLDEALRRAAGEGLELGTQQAAIDAFEFPEGFFDAVLCASVYCYAPLERIAASISRVAGALAPGGRFLCGTRSDADSRLVFGTAIGDHRVRLEGLAGTPAAAEEGLEMTFLDEASLRELFRPFTHVQVDRRSVTREGGRFLDDDWLVSAVR